jgi:hypothetical protein
VFRRRGFRDGGGGRPWLPYALIGLGAVAVVAVAVFAVRELTGDSSEASGPAPQTVKKTMWGPPFFADGTDLFPQMKDLGVGIFAIQARWDEIAPDRRPEDPTDPKDPAYEWPVYLKQQLNGAQRHGMQTQILIMGTPKWANGGKSWEWTPNDPGDFADFSTAISRKYPKTHLWMIWGEPNRQPNFKPLTPAPDAISPDDTLTPEQQVAPRNYAVLVDFAYEALKSQDPRNKVIAGDTYTSAGEDNIRPYMWAKYMTLPGGSRPRMDMWGHNPWGNHLPDLDDPQSPNGTVQFSDLGRLVKVLDTYFPKEKLKLFLAEWGVPTGFRDLDLQQELDAKGADKWLKAAFEIADWKRIYTLGWVHPVDTDRNSTGLLDEDGQRKSDYETYQDAR